MKPLAMCLPILVAACGLFNPPAPCVLPEPEFDKLGQPIAAAPVEHACRLALRPKVHDGDGPEVTAVEKPEKPERPTKTRKHKDRAGKKGGNPGNHKQVGKSGETPNGKGGWGSGDRGKGR